MRKLVLSIVALCVVGVVGGGVLAYLRPLPALYPVNKVQAYIGSPPVLSWPTTGEAAVGAVGYGVLASTAAQTPEPTASVAKLITTLAVLQKYPLQPGEQGPTLTLTAADVALYNQYVAESGSVVQVQAGEQLSEYQALEAMLLPSANNVADSLAIWAYGSLANYAAAANQLVQTLGLTQTIVGSDASGFDPSTTSTPADLVKLGEAALAEPVVAQIVAESQATLPIAGVVHNVNSLLGQDGVVGIKTGNSDQAGGVYLFAANDAIDSQSVEVVGAVMDAPNLSTAMASALPLLDSAKSNFTLTTAVKAGSIVASYTLPWGGTVNAIAERDASFINWRGTTVQSAPALHAIYAPLAAHATVGSISFTAGSKTASTPVVLQRALPNPPWYWRLAHFMR